MAVRSPATCPPVQANPPTSSGTPDVGKPPSVPPQEGKPPGLLKPPSATPELEGIDQFSKAPKVGSINTPPPAIKAPAGLGGDPLAEGLVEGKLTPKLPKAPLGKLSPKSGVGLAAAEGEAALSSRVLAGLGNIAFDIVLLVAAVVWELVVVPKLNKLQAQLDQWLLELEASRRKRMEEQIKKKFDVYHAKHIGRIVKSCWLGKLREIEKAGKTAFVNVKINVSFEDTSNRLQLFGDTLPDSLFELDSYHIHPLTASVTA